MAREIQNPFLRKNSKTELWFLLMNLNFNAKISVIFFWKKVPWHFFHLLLLFGLLFLFCFPRIQDEFFDSKPCQEWRDSSIKQWLEQYLQQMNLWRERSSTLYTSGHALIAFLLHIKSLFLNITESFIFNFGFNRAKKGIKN